MTCVKCGNPIDKARSRKQKICADCESVKPPKMHKPVYQDIYGDLRHLGILKKTSSSDTYAIFRRDHNTGFDADVSNVTGLPGHTQANLEIMAKAFLRIMKASKFERVA